MTLGRNNFFSSYLQLELIDLDPSSDTEKKLSHDSKQAPFSHHALAMEGVGIMLRSGTQ